MKSYKEKNLIIKLRNKLKNPKEVLKILAIIFLIIAVIMGMVLLSKEEKKQKYIEYNGKVFFDSKKKINIASQKRNVGFLFQNYALFPNMTVEENIKSGIRDKNKSINDIESVMRKFFIYKI